MKDVPVRGGVPGRGFYRMKNRTPVLAYLIVGKGTNFSVWNQRGSMVKGSWRSRGLS